MRCSNCGSGKSRVVDSRGEREHGRIYRRRRCLACGHRWATFELPVEAYDPDGPKKVLLELKKYIDERKSAIA